MMRLMHRWFGVLPMIAVAGCAFAEPKENCAKNEDGAFCISVEANESPQVWERMPLPLSCDLTFADGLTFEFFLEGDRMRFREYILRIYTSESHDAYRNYLFNASSYDGWGQVTVLKRNERSLSGSDTWGKVYGACLICVQGTGRGAARVAIRNITPVMPLRPEAVIVHSQLSLTNDAGKRVGWRFGTLSRIAGVTETLGIPSLMMSDEDIVRSGVPDSVKVAIFPYNKLVPHGMDAWLEEFLSKGGKVLWNESLPKPIAAIMKRHPESVRAPGGLFCEMDQDRRGNPCYESLGNMLTELEPSFSAHIAKAKAKEAREIEQARAKISAMKPFLGDVRMLSCQNPSIPISHIAAFAAKHGFTHLCAVVCLGPVARYDSDALFTLPEFAGRDDYLEQLKNACRTNGLKSVVSRICLRLPKAIVPAEIRKARHAEGYVALSSRGTTDCNNDGGEFQCPNHPEVRREEIAALTELSRKGVDVVNLDFIRYEDAEWCFCARCRVLFEKCIGRVVRNWPKDVMENGPLASEWTEFRVETITSLVRDASKSMRAAMPNVEIRVSGSAREYARRGLGQDWAAWCREGIVDSVGMMDYLDTVAGFRALIEDQRKIDVGRGVCYPIFGPNLWPDEGDAAQALKTAAFIEAIGNAGYRRFSMFQYDGRAERSLPMLIPGPLSKPDSGH